MTFTRHGVHRREDLSRLFNPRSVAIVGASPNEKSLGWRTAYHLRQFGGPVMLVNPKYDKIGNSPCYDSIRALPQTPDCVVITVPRDAVEQAIEDCADRGVGGAVIYAAGYAETGSAERIAMQQRLASIARGSGLKILGPNCLGFVNFPNRTVVTFSLSDIRPETERPSGVGIVSQSGAVGFGLFQASTRGVPMSHIIASGNSCSLDIADHIAYLADEPDCKAIACILEGLSDPGRIIEAGEIAWAANKALIVCKLGVSESGATAALSHSGSLAGSLDAYRAAFNRAGIIMLNELEALIETATFFAKVAHAPSAPGIGIVATSGGAAVSCTDKADQHGVPLPQPAPEIRAQLESQLPEFASARNPCDVSAAAGNRPELLYGASEILASDPQYGALVFPQVGANSSTGKRLTIMGDICNGFRKPLCVPWLSNWGGPGGKEIEAHPNVALFRSVERCFATLAEWKKRHDRRKQWSRSGPRKVERLSSPGSRAQAMRRIRACANATLTEHEAKAVLACYGIDVAPERLVHSEAQAVDAAQTLGYPVALKVESPDLPHKTEAGVVRLDLKSPAEIAEAYAVILANAASAVANPRIAGVLVQRMAPSGVEIMVGARMDPLFGPVILAGLGGIFVELLKDTCLELAPVTVEEALAMLGKLKGKAILHGFRGLPVVNVELLAQTIVRLSEFIDDQRDEVAELDVNPLICSATGVVAVDALIVRKAR